MHPFHSLPATLLALVAVTVCSSVSASSRPQDLPCNASDASHRSPFQDNELDRRAMHDAVASKDAAIESRLALEAPVGVRKMSEDATEKFFPEYWIFDDHDPEVGEDNTIDMVRRGLEPRKGRSEQELQQEPRHRFRNATATGQLYPPLLLHRDLFGSQYSLRDLLKRGYQCPTGYHNCASIDQDNTCCSTDQTCQTITDSGIGTVGCCESGDTCSGSVSSCDESQGYTSCPMSDNPNGCCSPGFVCDDVGCIAGDSSSVVPQTVGVTTQTLVSTAVIAPDPDTVYITTTTPTSTVVINPEAFSTATQVITTTIIGPVRATSVRDPSFVTSSAPVGVCPTGYYRCSAYYLGGCCQVGQDCQSTDCPSMASTPVATNGDDVTVYVGNGQGVTTISAGNDPVTTTVGTGVTVAQITSSNVPAAAVGAGGCPQSWYACGSDAGGGCCPSGYGCAATCSATQTGLPDTVQKVAPSNGAVNSNGLEYWMIALAGMLGIGMVWL